MKRWLACLLVLGGCASVTSPLAGVHLDVSQPQTTNTGHQASVTRTLQSTVEITGRITTGDPCYLLRAESSVVNSVVTVEIIARPNPAALCIQVIAAIPYRALVTGLSAGQYRVIVVHRYENSGAPAAQVLDTTVVVSG